MRDFTNYGILDNTYINRKRNYIERVLTYNIKKILNDELHNFTVIVGDTSIHVCDMFDTITFDYDYDIYDSYEYIVESFMKAFRGATLDDEVSRYNKVFKGVKLWLILYMYMCWE